MDSEPQNPPWMFHCFRGRTGSTRVWLRGGGLHTPGATQPPPLGGHDDAGHWWCAHAQTTHSKSRVGRGGIVKTIDNATSN